MTEKSQLEGVEEEYQRWLKEMHDYEIGIRDEPPRVFAEGLTLEEMLAKMRAVLDWIGEILGRYDG